MCKKTLKNPGIIIRKKELLFKKKKIRRKKNILTRIPATEIPTPIEDTATEPPGTPRISEGYFVL